MGVKCDDNMTMNVYISHNETVMHPEVSINPSHNLKK